MMDGECSDTETVEDIDADGESTKKMSDACILEIPKKASDAGARPPMNRPRSKKRERQREREREKKREDFKKRRKKNTTSLVLSARASIRLWGVVVPASKLVDMKKISDGARRFSFILETSRPGTFPDPPLVAALLSLVGFSQFGTIYVAFTVSRWN